MTQAQRTRSKASTSAAAATLKAGRKPVAQRVAVGRATVPAQPVANKPGTQGKAKAAPAAPKTPLSPLATPAASALETASTNKSGKKATKLRPVLVRDSFTMPESDFALLAVLKTKALAAGRAAKKSELLRAGLRQLMQLDAKPLAQALDHLEAVKTGRPKKGH